MADYCFVIQPFDGGKYDARYNSTFEPAIKSCNLEPYRVDRDPSVSIPIDEIEKGIRNARFCFAEISTDNPNVWFELGYAIACNKEVILVCSAERETKFPFDVQHRTIIKYRTDSREDYDKLETDIKNRIEAALQKNCKVHEFSESPVSEVKGLSNDELTIFSLIIADESVPGDGISVANLKYGMKRNGFNDVQVSLGVRKLLSKNMIESIKNTDDDGYIHDSYKLTDKGEKWLLNNENLVIRKVDTDISTIEEDDDLPF